MILQVDRSVLGTYLPLSQWQKNDTVNRNEIKNALRRHYGFNAYL